VPGRLGTLIIRIYFAQIMILAVIGVACRHGDRCGGSDGRRPLVASQIGVAVRTGPIPAAAAAAAFGC
jgi:hypothetical protein